MIRKVHTKLKFPRLPRSNFNHMYRTSCDWDQEHLSKVPTEKMERHLCDIIKVPFRRYKLDLNLMRIRNAVGHDDSHIDELYETCYILP